jgi:hypothetical protein
MEELQLLWKGVDTADALSEAEDKMFSLKAAVQWCIHDYLALCTLSGRNTNGYAACIHCDKDPLSRPLKGKNGYFGHFRFLPKKQRMRIGNMYLKVHKNHEKPGRFTAVELKELLEKVRQLSPEELQVEDMKKKEQAAMKRKESAAMKKKQKSASQQDKNKEADISKRNRSCHSEPQGSPPKTKKSDSKSPPIWGRRMSLWDLEYWPP